MYANEHSLHYIDKAATLHHIAVKWSNDLDEGRVGSLWSWTLSVDVGVG